MATNDKIVQSIDYTSRDYYSLRNDLIARVQTTLKENGKVWYGTDPADFGVAMVEAFAHVGDVTNYYIDRMANEAYLPTAMQRQSILNIAGTYGYRVAGYRQASVATSLVNSNVDAIVVPQGTVLSTTITVQSGDAVALVEEFFTVNEDVSVDANGGSESTIITHGRNVSAFPENAAKVDDPYDIPGELLGFSDGYSSQTFTLKYNHVVDGSVSVFVRNGDQFTEWSQVQSTVDYGPADAVYTVSADANNYVSVQFGDGVTGAVPVYGDEIKATYIVGGGVNGNLDSGKTFSVIKVPVGAEVTVAELNASLTIASTEKGYGGEDPESNDSIRVNAPKSFSAANRAVSLNDFKELANGVGGVGKATAYATNSSSVVVYVGPDSSDTSADYYPGVTANNANVTSAWTDLASDVSTELTSKCLLGTTVTVLPPVYVPVTISVEYVKSEGFSDAQVRGAVRYGIVYGFGYNFLDFDQTIRPEKVEQALGQIPGVETVKVLSMYRTGDSVGRSTLVAAQGEYFVYRNDTTKVYAAPSLSLLVATIGNGALTPAFTPEVTSYAIATTSSSMTVTPTAANTLTGFASTIKVNGTTVASGSASTSISLATGVNTVSVVLTSADTTLTKTYTVTVTRS